MIVLTEREQKGFIHEVNSVVAVEKAMPDKRFKLSHNPLTAEEWKRDVGKGADIKASVNGIRVLGECKSNQAQVHPSYILRDYYPRFKGERTKHRFIITDNLNAYSIACRLLLARMKIRLVTIGGFIAFLLSLLRGVTSYALTTVYINVYETLLMFTMLLMWVFTTVARIKRRDGGEVLPLIRMLITYGYTRHEDTILIEDVSVNTHTEHINASVGHILKHMVEVAFNNVATELMCYAVVSACAWTKQLISPHLATCQATVIHEMILHLRSTLTHPTLESPRHS